MSKRPFLLLYLFDTNLLDATFEILTVTDGLVLDTGTVVVDGVGRVAQEVSDAGTLINTCRASRDSPDWQQCSKEQRLSE